MADTKGRMGPGGPDPDRMQSLESPSRPAMEGDPADVARSIRADVEAQGVDVGSEDFEAMTGEQPHVGPTAGGG